MDFKKLNNIYIITDYHPINFFAAHAIASYFRNMGLEEKLLFDFIFPVELLLRLEDVVSTQEFFLGDEDEEYVIPNNNNLIIIVGILPPEAMIYAHDEYKEKAKKSYGLIRTLIQQKNTHLWFIVDGSHEGMLDDEIFPKSPNILVTIPYYLDKLMPGVHDFYRYRKQINPAFLDVYYSFALAALKDDDIELFTLFMERDFNNLYLDKQLSGREDYYLPMHTLIPLIILRSEKTRNFREKLSQVTPHTKAIFLYGEDGSGRDRVAEAIHYLTKGRWGKDNFVPVAPITSEKEMNEILFGRERKRGAVKFAERGTLFIDNIELIPLSIQRKILNFLHTGKFIRADGSVFEGVRDVNIILASPFHPEFLIKEGKLLRELYLESSATLLKIPPIREWSIQDKLMLIDQLAIKHTLKGIPVLPFIEEKIPIHLGSPKFFHYTIIEPSVLKERLGKEFRSGNIMEIEKIVERYLFHGEFKEDNEILGSPNILKFPSPDN